MSIVTMIGFVAAGLSIATLSMKTMVPLRIVAIASHIAFVIYGVLLPSVPTVVLHTIVFPLNIYRLYGMLTLIREAKAAAHGDLSIECLKPYMTKRAITAGETLFKKGDAANEMFFLVAGQLHLKEIGIDLEPGAVVGEMGFLAPGRKRTQTLACTESGSVLRISYDRIKELYFQSPTFGFHFLQLTTCRLFQNVERLEKTLAKREREISRLRKATAS